MGQNNEGWVSSYERFTDLLPKAIRVLEGESLLYRMPFGWHLDGCHIPNMAEHFSPAEVMLNIGLIPVESYGDSLWVVRKAYAEK